MSAMRERPRLVAFDLDGTAVRDGTVPASLVARLAGYVQSGGLVSTASGRNFRTQEQILAQSGITFEAGFPHFMVCSDKFVFRLGRGGYVEMAEIGRAHV